MNLETAMGMVAEALDARQADQDPTDTARSALLGLLAGKPVPGLISKERDTIRAWLRDAYGHLDEGAGVLYQHLLSLVVRRSPSGGTSIERPPGAHRNTGAYYTHPEVVRYMVGRAAAYAPDAKRAVDPACGDGVFLGGLRDTYGRQLGVLAGLDVDPVAAELCRQRVPEADVQVTDTLHDEQAERFDLCVGNPPYISSGLRGAAAIDRGKADYYRKRYPLTSQYKVNTYPLFVERGIELLRPGGVLGYIIPDTFLSGKFFQGLRQLLLQHTLLELTLIREDFWKHGHVGQSVILFVRKGPTQQQPHRVQIRLCDHLSDLADALGHPAPIEDVVWGSLQRFRLVPSAQDRSFVWAVERAKRVLPLGALVRTYSGLIAKHGQNSLLHSHNPTLEGPWGPLLRSGKAVDRYRVHWDGEQVCLQPNRIKSGGKLSHYTSPKLLLRQTADRLRVAYDDQGYYCLNNLHLLVPRSPALDLKTLMGILNSGPVNRYYRLMTREAGRLYAQVDLDLLQEIPIPTLNASDRARMRSLIDQRENATSEETALLERQIDHLIAGAFGLDAAAPWGDRGYR